MYAYTLSSAFYLLEIITLNMLSKMIVAVAAAAHCYRIIFLDAIDSNV